MQVGLFLVCDFCKKKHQNYRTSKPKNTQTKKLILKKYCSFCRQSQNHIEEIIKFKKQGSTK